MEAFAKALHARAVYPRRLDITALVGQVELDVSDDEFINVDVNFQVIGLSADQVRRRAVRVDLDAHWFLVMHPLHVPSSRLANLHSLRDKQDSKGAMQLEMAISVAREFIRSAAASASPAAMASGRSPIQSLVSEIEQLATGDAGKKVAARWGIHVADAIDPSFIPSGPFWTKRWPGLRTLMSPAWAERFAGPADPQTPAPATRKRAPR